MAKKAIDIYRQYYPQHSPYTNVPQTPRRFGDQLGRRNVQMTRGRNSPRPNYNARQEEMRVNQHIQESAQRIETSNHNVKKKNFFPSQISEYLIFYLIF